MRWPRTNRRSLRHYWRALWRDTRVLIRQSRGSLLVFLLLLCLGTSSLYVYYRYPGGDGTGLGLWQALHATFMLMLGEVILPFPSTPGLRVLFFLIPAVGLAAVVDGVLRFGSALFNRQQRKGAWQVAVASTYRNHIVICGLGKVGYRVVKELLRLGEEVVGIEFNPDGPFLEEIRGLNVPVLLGDARRQEMLDKAQVKRASAIVVCTQDDLTNLDIALEARSIQPTIKVVLRMFDGQLAERVKRGFSIHTAFSTSALAAPIFAAAATRAQIDHSFYVGDVLMNTARATLGEDSPLLGWSIADVERELDISIVLHKRGEVFDAHPSPDLTLQSGDCLVVFASLDGLARLRERSGEPCHVSFEKARPSHRPTLLRRLRARRKPEDSAPD